MYTYIYSTVYGDCQVFKKKDGKNPCFSSLSESTRRLILDRYVTRYERQIRGSTHQPQPPPAAATAASGDQGLAAEIMSVGPIQLDELDLDLTAEVAATAAAAAGER